MKTKVISQGNWPTFFDRFSQHYAGCLVTLEILREDLGAQVEEQNLDLVGITEEWDEMKGNIIIIMMGAEAGKNITHNINRPREVSLEQTDEGVDVALAIKSDDDTTALLRFQPSMLPEPVEAGLPAPYPISSS